MRRGLMLIRKGTVYLNLVVVLAFLVGQVQYSCSLYFCTMMNKRVTSSQTGSTSEPLPCCCPCNTAQGMSSSEHIQRIVASNCLRLIKSKKKVVSNFTSSGNSFRPIVGNMLSVSLDKSDLRSFTQGHLSIIDNKPPPLDLPIFNRILRI